MIVGIGRFLFRYRSYLPVVVYLTMLVLPLESLAHPVLLWVSGGVVVGFGVWLRLWAIRQIGKRARTRGDKARYLIQSGPFSMSRNPLYVANIAIGCGFCLAFKLPLYIVPAYLFLMGGFYSLVVRYEEDLLVSKFGAAYTEYAGRVPRWFPGIRCHCVDSEDTFSWREVLRWERAFLLNVFLGVVAAVVREVLV